MLGSNKDDKLSTDKFLLLLSIFGEKGLDHSECWQIF